MASWCWRCGDKNLTAGDRTLVMGILNLTQDSFSGDGLAAAPELAIERAHQMVREGADILDIGGESTRPGSRPVGLEEEIRRTIPVIRQVTSDLSVPISIDTYKSAVAEAALDAGACIVNDITALRADPAMAALVARRKAGVVLMHIQGTPSDMQLNPTYSDLISEISDHLRESLVLGERAGIAREQMVVDPGIGFGKTVEHNLTLLRRLSEFRVLGVPVLVGTSRKSFIGKTLDLPVDERLEGTAATVAIAIANGADIVRVHDVRQMVRVARMTDAIVRSSEPRP